KPSRFIKHHWISGRICSALSTPTSSKSCESMRCFCAKWTSPRKPAGLRLAPSRSRRAASIDMPRDRNVSAKFATLTVSGLLLASVSFLQPAAVGSDKPTPLVVSDVRARSDITALFARSDGWTGADSAYSIVLSEKRALWLFGDTWIGKISGGKRL